MTMPARKFLMAVEQTLFKARACARELNAADDVFFLYIHRYGMKSVLSDDTEESLFDLFLSMECRDSNGVPRYPCPPSAVRSEEHTSELQSLMRISYADFCLKKKNKHKV